MRATFLGTGTSSGIPLLACDCEVCTSNDFRDKRQRSSLLIEVQDRRFIIDVGPDFRTQMLRHNVKHLDAVLITHGHRDHIAGLDELRAYNFATGKNMPIYADSIAQKMIKGQFPYIFEKDPYPGVPRLEMFPVIHERNLSVEGIGIDPVQIYHGNLPITGYRIGGLAYLTDISRIDAIERKKLAGIDTLIISAIRYQPHHSHFNLDEALECIEAIQPNRAYLMHFSHHIGKHEALEKKLPSSVYAAYDDLIIEVS